MLIDEEKRDLGSVDSTVHLTGIQERDPTRPNLCQQPKGQNCPHFIAAIEPNITGAPIVQCVLRGNTVPYSHCTGPNIKLSKSLKKAA